MQTDQTLGPHERALAAARHLDAAEGLVGGTPDDQRAALDHLRAAADLGNPTGHTGVGVHYWHGIGIGQDYSKAVERFRMGAEGGDTAAAYWLGVAYAEGKGVTPDPAAARRYLERAASSGEPGASTYLAALASPAAPATPAKAATPAGLAAFIVAGVVGGAAAFFAGLNPLGVAAAFIVAGGLVAVIMSMLKPKPDAKAEAFAAVARQQIHGGTGYDEGTI